MLLRPRIYPPIRLSAKPLCRVAPSSARSMIRTIKSLDLLKKPPKNKKIIPKRPLRKGEKKNHLKQTQESGCFCAKKVDLRSWQPLLSWAWGGERGPRAKAGKESRSDGSEIYLKKTGNMICGRYNCGSGCFGPTTFQFFQGKNQKHDGC